MIKYKDSKLGLGAGIAVGRLVTNSPLTNAALLPAASCLLSAACCLAAALCLPAVCCLLCGSVGAAWCAISLLQSEQRRRPSHCIETRALRRVGRSWKGKLVNSSVWSGKLESDILAFTSVC